MIDKEIGQKILDFFNEEGFDIELKQESGPIFNLDYEKSFTEYRVYFKRYENFEQYLMRIESKSPEDFVEEYGEDTLAEYKEEFENKESDDFDYLKQFSVFLPNGSNTVQDALYDASQYLVLLNNTIPDVIIGGIDDRYDALLDEEYDLGKFLKQRLILIHNNNINKLPNIAYRIYEDSKWFRTFREEFESTYKDFFIKWLEILGEKENISNLRRR